MPLSGKLVCEFDINVAAEMFYKMFKKESFHLPTISPKFIKQVEVHGGDWDSHGHGSIKIWNYITPDGEAGVLKEQVEFNDEKLMVTKIGLEGDVLNYYKTIKFIYKVVPKDQKLSLIILTIEYEKLNHSSPYPYKYMDTIIGLTKDIESHLK
ncbi:MLP-like protein 328 [Benincasa hispida]|uniref:MLP-like protein 328 n=1 Tax=Benincasa hispida TaxID=102211 RepID=UPI001902BAF0|nr:MLP-like protein 328 [Benincasa hispida]